MIDLRHFADLGAFANDWLDTRHHFSFGRYYDPARMGVGGLRVWNDDVVAPGTGFEAHPHRDMEIITYVRSGAITHKDNLGNLGRTEAGDVQVMHAGTGIVHAEYNDDAEPVSLFQIWIMPDQRGVAPGWATRRFPKSGGLSILASGRARDAGSAALPLYADAALAAGTLAAGETASYALGEGRAAYLVPGSGRLRVNGTEVLARDGLVLTNLVTAEITAIDTAELVLVDVRA